MSRRRTNINPVAHWRWPIPKSWAWVRISEVADVIGGGTPSTTRYEFWEGGKIAWITPADLTGYNEREISRGARFITQAGVDNSSARLLPARSVLFSSRAPVGYVAIAANPLATNQGFKSFVLSEGILPEYVYFYLRRAKEEITKLASGTTFVEISARACAGIPLPIAPSGEQVRIVAKLDALLSRVAAGEAAARRALERLKRYRAAVLHAAVTGELTRDWRKTHHPDETGAQLLKRLLQERRARWEDTELKRLRAVSKSPNDDKWKNRYPEPAWATTGVLPAIPKSWTWVTLEQVTLAERPICYGILMPKQHVPDGIPYVRVRDMKREILTVAELKRTSPKIAAAYSRATLRKGDLVLAIRGTYGRIAVVPPDLDGGNITQDTARLAVCPEVNTAYVMWAIRSEFLQAHFNEVARGIAVRGVNIADVRLTPLPLPPVDEQAEILSDVERRLIAADQLAATLNHQLSRASATRQSLLREAFTGKLVPQDSKDEPASVLLDRIRAAREVEAKKPKPKRMPKSKLRFKSVETLEQFEELVHDLSTGATPERLLLAAGLGDDVEKFFDLLRAGRDKGSLVVPVGKGTAIRRVQHAN